MKLDRLFASRSLSVRKPELTHDDICVAINDPEGLTKIFTCIHTAAMCALLDKSHLSQTASFDWFCLRPILRQAPNNRKSLDISLNGLGHIFDILRPTGAQAAQILTDMMAKQGIGHDPKATQLLLKVTKSALVQGDMATSDRKLLANDVLAYVARHDAIRSHKPYVRTRHEIRNIALQAMGLVPVPFSGINLTPAKPLGR